MAAKRVSVGRVFKWIGITIGGLILALILGFVLVPPATRGFTNTWGATPSEVKMPLPGDEYLGNPSTYSTKAVTIDAPGSLVYKLLLQMGYKRGGWYGWDWFYNATGSGDFVGGKYARTIVPQLQKLRVGDMIYINKAVGYKVVELDQATSAKPGWMLMEGAMAADGKILPPSTTDPKATKMSWVWFIYPAADGQTRLVLRIRNGGASMGPFLDWLFANPLDFGGAVMGYKTLWGIKKTAETLNAAGVR